MGKKLNLYDFLEKSKIIHNEKYDYSEIKEYINNKKRYTIRCIKHDMVFEMAAYAHLMGQGCRECKKEKLSKIRINSLEFVLSSFIEKHGDKYDYSNITEYLGCDEIISIICKKHGEFKQSSRNHWSGQGCPKCYNERRHTIKSSNIEDFIKKSKIIHGDKYDYSKSIYKNSKTKLEIICKLHGSFFKRPNNHINGSIEGCPKCTSSYGESKIFTILKGNNINFNTQKTYKDCFYKGVLRFDFYLPKYNMCIEYNGDQHYKPIDFFGGNEQYDKNKIRDDIKKKYCSDNNIKLLIIKSNENILDALKIALNINLMDVEYTYYDYLPYYEAIDLLLKSGIKSQKEYKMKYKEISNQLPAHPHKIYEYYWNGWMNFLSKDKQIRLRDSKGMFVKH